MEKTRVKRGKEYYFINIYFKVMSDYEYETDIDNYRFDTNNYFVTEEEAESTARKLHAVLKGADVIEMPSGINVIMKNQEDLAFLQQLQAKLRQADNNPKMHDYQANPRFWVVMDQEEIVTSDGDIYHVMDLINNVRYTFAEYIDCVENEVYSVDTDEMYNLWAKVDKSDIDNVRDFATDEFNHLTEVVNISLVDRIAPNTFFLTKEAAEKHINANRHHYNNPRTYAMTAWRSPEFERFMELFKNMNLLTVKAESL